MIFLDEEKSVDIRNAAIRKGREERKEAFLAFLCLHESISIDFVWRKIGRGGREGEKIANEKNVHREKREGKLRKDMSLVST